MADLIQNKMNQILGDISRPTKFKCQIYLPEKIKLDLQISGQGQTNSLPGESAQYLDYFCFASSFPGLTVQTIDFKFKGRNLPIKSIQEYSQKWTATFYNDEQHSVRRAFLEWMLYDQSYQYEDKKSGKVEDTLTSISIYQLDYELSKDCVVYTMLNVFPINVGDIEVSYDNLNQVETFTVEFAYTHFEINTVSGQGLTSSDVKELINNTIQNTINGLKNSLFDFAENLVSPIVESVSDSFENFIMPRTNKSASSSSFIGSAVDKVKSFLK